MPVITNAELKRRLEAHNFPVPPITDSTKGVLIKKLEQLDNGRNGGKSRHQTKKLFDYSSAEDESAPSTPNLRRRVTSATTKKNGDASVLLRKKVNGSNGQPKGQLMHFSESEGDDEEKDSSSEDEDEEEEEDENNEDESEEEEEEDHRVDFGLQTSPSLDTSRDSTFRNFRSPSSDNFTPPSSENRPRSGGRFSSSTPVGPIRSTATYLESGPKVSPKTGPSLAFPPTSPLRRAVAKNKAAFGSLGKFLIFLP